MVNHANGPENGAGSTPMLRSILSIVVFVGLFHFLLPEVTFSQGETTSAIIGQVSDASGAAVPGATVTITNKETGLKRSARPMTRAGSTSRS